MTELFDTHCHIHFPDYGFDPEEVIAAARSVGVTRLMAVGCSLPDSRLGIQLAKQYKNVWASIGLHPHEASEYVNDHLALQQFREISDQEKVVAIGETGLDYHYMHSSKHDQIKLFRFQLDLGIERDLPFIFHVRDAFDDFFAILSEYSGIKGVVHSFASNKADLDKIVSNGLHIGLNGIATFTKDKEQLEAMKAVPLQNLLLETDAPYLTPNPFRGKICQPKYLLDTARFLADLRGESSSHLGAKTTNNAKELFGLNE